MTMCWTGSASLHTPLSTAVPDGEGQDRRLRESAANCDSPSTPTTDSP